METKVSAEHHLNLRMRTVLLMIIPASGVVVGAVGFAVALCAAITGKLRWEGTAFICVLSLLVALGFGWVVLKFARRVLAVKSVQVLAGQQLEIKTRTNHKFTAKLPDDIRYAITDRGFLTIAVGVGGNVFVIDSAEYSNSEQLNFFFQQFANGLK